ELESQLARLALEGRGLDSLAAAIGAFLGRAVVIEGRRGDALAVHVPTELPEAAAAVSRYIARPGQAPLRVAIPAPPGESGAGGRLILLGEEPANEFERIAADRIAALLALELARDVAVRQARDDARRGDPLPKDGPPWIVLLARQTQDDDPDDVAAREATRAELRLLASPRRLVLRGTSESLELRMVAATASDDLDGRLIASRLAGFLQRTVAISRPFSEAGGRPAAEATARTTLEATELLDAPPRVALAARLPAYLMLGNLRNLPDGLRQARTLLAPILVGRAETQRQRVDTLRAVLESPGLNEAAARLGVHRNTVAYRAGRLEQLGGWDLRDPDLRLALMIAARLVQKEQTATAIAE
ncbi:MAG TPA: helix-turn-helix domain-containing protein, partial [Patescibacteria group bacterium]|nr:helix-turn-helix domain-containing protein [Patescibacteria group bacterium]